MSTQPWQARAACAGKGDLFARADREAATGSCDGFLRAALTICAGCPVTTQCAAWAAAEHFTGVAAGTTNHHRRSAA